MLRIIAKNTVKSDHIENYKMMTKELIEKSQLEEGCIFYDLFQDVKDEAILTFIEIWKSQETIDLHNDSEHYKRIIPQLQTMVNTSEVNIYKEL